MISDQDMRGAAQACEKAIVESILKTEDEPACFSPGFERSMKKLIFRVDHPVLYFLSRLLPILLLAVALGAVNLLLNRTDYALPAPSSPAQSEPEPLSAEPVIYRPSWLPEGCVLDREALYDAEGMIVYKTAQNAELVFLYSTQNDPADESELKQGKSVYVGDCPGIFRVGQSKGAINDLVWMDEKAGAAFWLSAPYSEDILIQIAESVEKQNKK